MKKEEYEELMQGRARQKIYVCTKTKEREREGKGREGEKG